jgi:hypothetical protein
VKKLLEHPSIAEMNKKGYLGGEDNMNCGSDVFGFEILAGDEIVEFDGEVVLKEHLEEFLKDLGFEFKKAE